MIDPKEEKFSFPPPSKRNTFDKEGDIRDIFHSRMIAITRQFPRRIVAHSASIPAGLRRSVKPRLHPRKEEEGEGRLAYLYLSQSPSPDFLLVFLARLLKRFLLKRRSQGRARQDNVINYGASKPPRAFICTALALSLAPLLIFFLVEEGYRPSQTSLTHAYSWLQINNETFGIQF